MIRFFQKLRRQLLTHNQVNRYLLYALGEVFLVVIGILIALQIDTWNEERKDRLAEKGIIENLRQEFEENRAELDSILTILNKTREANMRLMGFFGKPREDLEMVNLDSIVFYSVEYRRFIPTQNALTDLLQSGRLELITKETLKNALYDWTRVMGQIEESYSGVKQKTEEDIVPYLTSRYPLKNIDYYGAIGWQEPSRLPHNKLEVFSQLEYENLIDDHLYRLMRYENDLKKARILIGEILHIIENDP